MQPANTPTLFHPTVGPVLHRAPGERLQQLQLQLDECLHWHRKCPSIPNCKYHTGIPLDQARKQSKGLQSQRPAGPSHGYSQCCGPHADVRSCLSFTQTCFCIGLGSAAKILSGLQAGEAEEWPLHRPSPSCKSGLSKCPDPAEDQLGSADPNARAESTPFRLPWAYKEGWDPTQITRLVPEAHAMRQLPSERWKGCSMEWTSTYFISFSIARVLIELFFYYYHRPP